MSNDNESEPRGGWKPAIVFESPCTPKQRARNFALYDRLCHGVPPEKRTGGSREGIGLHVFQFSVPLADCSIGGPGPEVSFNLKPGSECLHRLCSYITDHFDTRCDADDDVDRLTKELNEARERREDYLVTWTQLVEAGVPTRDANGTPMTLAERVRWLVAKAKRDAAVVEAAREWERITADLKSTPNDVGAASHALRMSLRTLDAAAAETTATLAGRRGEE